MKKNIIRIIILSVSLAAGFYLYHIYGRTCCSPRPDQIINHGITYDKKTDLSPLPETKEVCLEQNGEWKKIGLSREEKCNVRTADAGTVCADSSQCEGACIGENTDSTSGQCSEWRLTAGCHAFVYNGRVPGILCAD